jgi:hypothetical protein
VAIRVTLYEAVANPRHNIHNEKLHYRCNKEALASKKGAKNRKIWREQIETELFRPPSPSDGKQRIGAISQPAPNVGFLSEYERKGKSRCTWNDERAVND